MTSHQYFCSGISGQNSNLQQDLGRTLATYSTGSAHLAAIQAIRQLGKMILWHG
jgi:hypothetical protein